MKTKKLFYLFAVVFLSFGLLSGCGKKDTADKKDGQKTEDKKDVAISENTPYHLKYDMTGETEKGSMDMFVKGKTIKLDIKAKDKGQDVSSVMFVKEGMVYMVMEMMGQKQGIKMDVSKDENFKKDFGQLYDVKDKLKDFTKGGTEEIIGYKCDIYSKGESKIWIYKDMVALKYSGGKINLVASVFESEAKLSDDFFDPPKDIDFKSMDDFKPKGQ